MNWQIESLAASLDGAYVDVTHGPDEDLTTEPDSITLNYAKTVAATFADHVGGSVLITINGHETTTGDGFRPAHVSITVSRQHPNA